MAVQLIIVAIAGAELVHQFLTRALAAEDERFARRRPWLVRNRKAPAMSGIDEYGHLDRDRYLELQNAMQSMNTLVLGFKADELAAFIRTAEYATIVGPFEDPTLWIRGRDSLQKVIDCATALQAYHAAIARVAETVRR